MKQAILSVATLLAAAFAAQGQTITSAVELAAHSWRTNVTENFTMVDGATGIRLKDPGAKMPEGIVESLKAAAPPDIGGSGLWMLAQACKAGDAAAGDKLETISEDPKVSDALRQSASANYLHAGATKGNLKKHVDRVGINDKSSRGVRAASVRLNDPAIWEDFCASAKGKGIAEGNYRKWYLAHIKGQAPNDQLFSIQQEIAGLMRNAEDMNTAKLWVEELRYRLYVTKEAIGP